jgi:hypothetical protein
LELELIVASTILAVIVVGLPLLIHFSKYLGPKSVPTNRQNEAYE